MEYFSVSLLALFCCTVSSKRLGFPWEGDVFSPGQADPEVTCSLTSGRLAGSPLGREQGILAYVFAIKVAAVLLVR